MASTSSAPATATKPLSFMEKLGPLVSIYRPSQASDTGEAHQPRLVIVSTWTDAKDVHIAKYIAKYQTLYPAAQILLLKSTMECIVHPSRIGPAMTVAATAVRAAFQTPVVSSSPPLLIHMLSNGGSSSIANLYEQFAATAGPNDDKHLPSHVSIFDSSPGRFQIPRAVAFASVGLPFFLKLVATPFLYAFATMWFASMTLGLIPDSVGSWYKSHNEDAGNSNEVRRVYIYSPTDVVVDYKDVETHAAEAKTNGFSVAIEKYKGSAHVAHIRKDETRYWDIVEKAMEG